eukprot:11312086-Ditylum_brightwellii.AAC.1
MRKAGQSYQIHINQIHSCASSGTSRCVRAEECAFFILCSEHCLSILKAIRSCPSAVFYR